MSFTESLYASDIVRKTRLLVSRYLEDRKDSGLESWSLHLGLEILVLVSKKSPALFQELSKLL